MLRAVVNIEKQGNYYHPSKREWLPLGEERGTEGLLIQFSVCILCILYHNLKQSLKKMNSTETAEVEEIRTCIQEGKRKDLESDSPGFKS